MTALGSLLAIACGAEDATLEQASGRASGTRQGGLEDTEALELSLQAANDLVCPTGSKLDTSGSKLCVVGSDAIGPFSLGMI